MKKNIFKPIIIALSVLWIIYIIVFYTAFKANNNSKAPINQVCISENCFFVELAITQAQKQQWLMFVENLPKDQWMIFVYDEPNFYSFWMKNTLIDLDIIWINADKEIVYIQNAKPCKTETCPSYTPTSQAQYILEINWWLAEEYNINISDKVSF